jgi:hypothetical protein
MSEGLMSYTKRSGYGLLTAAVLLSCLFSAKLVEAAPQAGVCSGVLTRLEGRFLIEEEPEHICIFGGEAERKIFAICAEGHLCEVEGMLDDCKSSGECSEIMNVVSVRDLTLAKRQEQPPLPDAPPSSVPAGAARLPVEIHPIIEAITRTCGSPANVLGNFSSYLADRDNRFVVLHFENIRCNDLTAICKTKGCLHQVYISRDNQPYRLVVSTYVSEIELKHLDNTVAVEVTSSEGARLLRWDGAGFH